MFQGVLSNAVKSGLPMIVILVVVLVLVRVSTLRGSGKRFVLHNEIMDLLFVVYVLLLFELLTGTENSYGSQLNLVPFKEILRYEVGSKMFYYNVLGNIIAFMPFGFFIARMRKGKGVFWIFMDAFLTSLTVEFMQLRVGRSFDIDDILLNVLGGLLGYLVFVGLDAIRKHLPSFLQSDFIYNVFSIIILLVCVAYVMRVMGIGWVL